jgi:hypothetical protein
MVENKAVFTIFPLSLFKFKKCVPQPLLSLLLVLSRCLSSKLTLSRLSPPLDVRALALGPKVRSSPCVLSCLVFLCLVWSYLVFDLSLPSTLTQGQD